MKAESADMDPYLGDLDAALDAGERHYRPPPKLSLSAWAERYFFLSAESSAEPGPWHTIPYQREIMDCFTDPAVEKISVMKSARVGYTKILNAVIGYFIHYEPSSVLLVQPTVDDARGYSKEELAPMIRDCPVLTAIVHDDPDAESGPKESSNTTLHKIYPGGFLSLVGANSGAGFRRKSSRVVAFDEVDAYPPSAGSDGDQIELGSKRTQAFWNRKIAAGSTPLVAGSSRIAVLFEQGDQRRYYVPCPHCNHMDFLVWRQKADQRGHYMAWDEGDPSGAYFVCSKNGCVIEHKDRGWMVDRGEWRAGKPFKGHASFHIWAAYSPNANASWGKLVEEFLSVKDSAERLRTFVNTVLGELWEEQGDAPDWDRLYNRRESYGIGTVPAGVRFLTAGVDVQRDRVAFEVVGWGAGKESWSVDAGSIPFDTHNAAEWTRVDDLLNRTYPCAAGSEMGIAMLAIDSGDNTQMVYSWARRHLGRVIAIKGSATEPAPVRAGKPIDVMMNGKKVGSCKVWIVGVSVLKPELYGWLRLKPPEPGSMLPYPSGYCHFPPYGPDFFKELTAETLVGVVNRQTKMTKYEWHKLPGRRNEQLDCRIYARAAANLRGLDRMRSSNPAPSVPVSGGQKTDSAPPRVVIPEPAPQKQAPEPKKPSWLGKGGIRNPNQVKGWLGRRKR